MREIKTEAQTANLAKVLNVEVTLAELIVIRAALSEVNSEDMRESIELRYSEDVAERTKLEVPHEITIANDIGNILDMHILEED
ncbi:hypothetical protein ACN6A9_01610 [Bacillus safensis]